jgi:hypothetical protein
MPDWRMPQLAPVYELRTQPTIYALYGGLFGAPVLLGVFVAIAKEPTLWPPTAAVGLMLAILMSWLMTTRLTLTSDSIHYRSLFSRTRVPLANVLKVRFERGFVAFSYRPYLRVIITFRDGAGKKDIMLNAGLFDPALVGRWIDTVNSKLS